jgi:hypothetical protein
VGGYDVYKSPDIDRVRNKGTEKLACLQKGTYKSCRMLVSKPAASLGFDERGKGKITLT